MNHKEAVAYIMAQAAVTPRAAGITKDQAWWVINTYFEGVVKTLVKGGAVSNPIGSFVVSKHAARVGRDIRTGLPMAIDPCKSIKLKPSKAVKQRLN